MERKGSMPGLAECLRRSFSWSVNARFSANEGLAGLVTHSKHSTKDATSSAEENSLKIVKELCSEALKRGSKNELNMRGLLASISAKHEELHSTPHEALMGSSTDIHVTVLGEALKELKWLTQLDISGNGLTELPESLGELVKLRSLMVSENELVALPRSIGKLKELTTLNIEKNRIEELPWAIAQCKSLTYINGDFNNLKSLPDSVGQLGKLKRLTVHFNCLKSLPRSMAGMTSLVELDVRFNHLVDIPENVCLVTSLVRLNLASNFSDLKHLPESIGRLQQLRELDVSFNSLTHLPDSFAMLTNLQTLNLEGNPLFLPPLPLAEQGREVVLNYMIKHVERENKKMQRRRKGYFARFLYNMSRRLKRRNGRVNEDHHLALAHAPNSL